MIYFVNISELFWRILDIQSIYSAEFRKGAGNPYGEKKRCHFCIYYSGLSSPSVKPVVNIDWSRFNKEEASVVNQELPYSKEFQTILKQSLAQWVFECKYSTGSCKQSIEEAKPKYTT